MGGLIAIETLDGFDFVFQSSLDRNRILALAQREFIDRHEVVHFLGQPSCGKTRLAIALGIEAVKARPCRSASGPFCASARAFYASC